MHAWCPGGSTVGATFANGTPRLDGVEHRHGFDRGHDPPRLAGVERGAADGAAPLNRTDQDPFGAREAEPRLPVLPRGDREDRVAAGVTRSGGDRRRHRNIAEQHVHI